MQKARQALAAGAEAVVLPLGLECPKERAYKLFKLSAFVFETPEQRARVLRQLQRFERRTGCGLELLVLRRAYGGRRQGSLADLAGRLHQMIRAGQNDLLTALNISKLSPSLKRIAITHKQQLQENRAQHAHQFLSALAPAAQSAVDYPTAWVLTLEDLDRLEWADE
jgi:hypothetical protein